jgi:ribosomal protein S1
MSEEFISRKDRALKSEKELAFKNLYLKDVYTDQYNILEQKKEELLLSLKSLETQVDQKYYELQNFVEKQNTLKNCIKNLPYTEDEEDMLQYENKD